MRAPFSQFDPDDYENQQRAAEASPRVDLFDRADVREDHRGKLDVSAFREKHLGRGRAGCWIARRAA